MSPTIDKFCFCLLSRERRRLLVKDYAKRLTCKRDLLGELKAWVIALFSFLLSLIIIVPPWIVGIVPLLSEVGPVSVGAVIPCR